MQGILLRKNLNGKKIFKNYPTFSENLKKFINKQKDLLKFNLNFIFSKIFFFQIQLLVLTILNNLMK